jgi:hypothetical protein
MNYSEYQQLAFGLVDLDGDSVIMLPKSEDIQVADYIRFFNKRKN